MWYRAGLLERVSRLHHMRSTLCPANWADGINDLGNHGRLQIHAKQVVKTREDTAKQDAQDDRLHRAHILAQGMS
jgi:hypothetical protein